MRVSISDSAKKNQERFVTNLTSLRKNSLASKYYRVADDACSTMAEKSVCAGIMNNWQKILDSDLGQALTTSQDFGPYVMEIWPLVTAWYPDFPLKDLISVQDMDKPLAYMFFSLLRTGTNKADTVVGDVVETATGMRTIRGKYPTGEIVGETILDTDIKAGTGALLAYAPLNVATIPGYLDKTIVKIGDDTYQAVNVVNGVISFQKAGADVTAAELSLDVQTGLLSGTVIDALAANTGAAVASVNYVWNLDYAKTDNIQTIKEQVELRPMEATPRALMLEWTLFSEYLKKSQFGQDIREDNTKRVLNLLYQYQVRYILDELYDYAAGTAVKVNGTTITPTTNISLTVQNNYSLEVQVANVMKQLKVVGNAIEIASGRMEGNRIVCGQNFKAWLESLPSTYFTPKKEDSAFSGPREIGTFGTYTVYYDPYRGADEGFMTYRGSEFYDAAYYLGEYMPIVPTDAIALGVTVRSSFVSMEAYRFDKKSCVYKLKFTL